MIREQVEAMPAPPEGEIADDGDYEPSIAPEPISEPPKDVAPPIDIPKSKKGDLKLKEDLPHFGDELDLCVEKSAEPGDMPLDEEDGEVILGNPVLEKNFNKLPNHRNIC